jgi:hypothetical protein
MIKICKKKDCNNTAIARGKYCNIHRTNKAKNNIPILREETKYNNVDEDIEIALKLSLETLKIEKTNKIEEDRKLKIDQESAFDETVKLDIERMNRKKVEVEELENKRINISKNNPTEKENYFNIKIKLPSNKALIKKFKEECYVRDIRDYLDVYFFDNNINIKNYILLINALEKKTLENSDLISSLNMSNNFMIFLEDLDS